jgi:phage FluMu protein Com
MTDQPPPDPPSGDEPMLSFARLRDQIASLQDDPPPGFDGDQLAMLATLQNRIDDLERQIRDLVNDPEVVRLMFQTGYPRTGRRFPLRMPRYRREQPEIMKTSWCRECGRVWSYEVYATGWTRKLCPDCKAEVRRRQNARYARERRRREREARDGGE